MYSFLFAGRHEREKGFDILIDTIELIRRNFPETFTQVQFIIIAHGSMTDAFLERFSMEPWFFDARQSSISSLDISELPQVVYLGHQNKDNVLELMQKVDFVLMPSRCLETFGLVALEAASRGTPTIARAKGGLESLILPDASLSDLSPQTLVATIGKLIRRLSDEGYEILSDEVFALTHQFSDERWLEIIRATIGPAPQKILMLSDYTTFIGGAETHVETIRRLLKHVGYEVEVAGWELEGTGKILALKRYLGIFLSLFNIFAHKKIQEKIQSFTPDVIWCHSVSRYFGWYPLTRLPTYTLKCISYHDLGYFTPRPSMTEEINEMIPKMTLSSWLEREEGWRKYIAFDEIFRFLEIKLLQKILKKFDFHFVPSDFMREPAVRIMEIDRSKLFVLPHFYEERIQKTPPTSPLQTR